MAECSGRTPQAGRKGGRASPVGSRAAHLVRLGSAVDAAAQPASAWP
jgi:hypothetical protein